TQELRDLNNLEEDVIRVGQQLIVHQVRSTPVVEEGAEESTPQGRFVTYRVESGENLTRILDRFLMTEEELKGLNPGTDLNSLRNGQRITVLLPPSRSFANPYLESSGLEDLGELETTRYRDDQAAAPTTSGELYNPHQLTAAHANMALGSIIYVENPSTGRGTYVKVNDRIRNDGIKLSEKAFRQLGFRDGATASVRIYQQD
ncbi:MAG: LysM peptidoglycan-binding domain-containing protein, partial [Balneolaceae bacterium]